MVSGMSYRVKHSKKKVSSMYGKTLMRPISMEIARRVSGAI